MPTSIWREDVLRLVREKEAQLVDALPVREFEDEHISGAINIPLKKLDAESTLVFRSGTPCHCLLTRRGLRHKPTGRGAARDARVFRCLRLCAW